MSVSRTKRRQVAAEIAKHKIYHLTVATLKKRIAFIEQMRPRKKGKPRNQRRLYAYRTHLATLVLEGKVGQ